MLSRWPWRRVLSPFSWWFPQDRHLLPAQADRWGACTRLMGPMWPPSRGGAWSLSITTDGTGPGLPHSAGRWLTSPPQSHAGRLGVPSRAHACVEGRPHPLNTPKTPPEVSISRAASSPCPALGPALLWGVHAAWAGASPCPSLQPDLKWKCTGRVSGAASGRGALSSGAHALGRRSAPCGAFALFLDLALPLPSLGKRPLDTGTWARGRVPSTPWHLRARGTLVSSEAR